MRTAACISRCPYIRPSPPPTMSKRMLSYRSLIDQLVHCVSELLFPNHVNLLEIQLLCMTSKQMRNALAKRNCIMQEWMRALGYVRKPIGLLTVLKARNLLHTNNSASCLYSVRTEVCLAIQHACVFCGNHALRTRKDDKTNEPFFTNYMDDCAMCSCDNPNRPSWAQRQACEHPIHGPSFKIETREIDFGDGNRMKVRACLRCAINNADRLSKSGVASCYRSVFPGIQF